MFKKLAFACSLAAAFVLFTSAKPSPVGNFDKAVESIVKDMDVVGLSTAVVSGNKIIFSKAYGVKNLDTQEPLTTDAYFKVGYCGRVLVPIAIIQCYDNGLLDLKDDVSKYLGFELRNPSYPDTPITINNLLKQTSSLTDAKGWKSIENLQNNSEIEGLWNDSKPGVKYKKCNKGYNVLAAIVEKVTGVPFWEYAKNYILDPLQIDASFNPGDYKSSRVACYSYKDGEFKRASAYVAPKLEEYVPGESTFKMKVTDNFTVKPEDMAKIVLTLMNNGECPLTKVRLYSESASAKLLKPNKANTRCSGMSITAKDIEGTLLYFVTAAPVGSFSIFAFEPTSKIGFFAACNGSTDKSWTKEMRKAFVEAFF